MYHLILFMPLIGLVLFWLLPFSFALPLYLLILFISGFIYFVMVRAMRKPVTTGTKALVGKSAQVIESTSHEFQVWVEGAIWQARSDDTLHKGDLATIIGVEDLTLFVKKAPAPQKTADTVTRRQQ